MDVAAPGPAQGAGAARLLPPVAVVPVLTLVWLAVAAAVLPQLSSTSVAAVRPVPALLLLPLFAGCQALVINVQLRREARSVFLSEVPTFLALMALPPVTMAWVRLLGLLIGFGLLRKQYRHPEKLVFNAALALAEAAVASLVCHALLPADHGSPVAWLAAGAGTVASSSFTAAGVGLVISLLEGTVRLRALLRLCGAALLQAVPVTMIGTVAWAAWQDSPWGLVPLVGVSALLLLAYRVYAGLRERYLALERLYRSSQVMSEAHGVDAVLRGVLEQAREILHTERARVAFPPGGVDGAGLEVVLSSGSAGLERSHPARLDAAYDAVLGGTSVLVPRGTRVAEQRAWLEEHGLRDSLMVPLLGERGPIGVLAVDDRLGDARGVGPDDVRVLETVANQAAVALRNGQLLEQLRHESLHDPLTGLPNRLHLLRELDRRLDEGVAGIAVGILDLDTFKDVNDTLGHAEGDRLLCEVADRLRTSLGHRALVARLGGDEFALLVEGRSGDDAVDELAQLLRSALAEPVLLSGIEVDVAASLGVALAPQHGDTAGLLVQHADQAMYDAKSSGRAVRVFEAALDTSSPARLALVRELRAAIERGEVEVHVQPKVDASTGAVVGTEALARWSTPARGPVSPGEFVPLAERSGLVQPLTELVLERAVEACAEWQGVAPGVGVSVNVSVRSLSDDGLVRLVDRVLRRRGLAPDLLTLEITEGHIMADPAGSLSVLNDLRDRGVRLSVDDFGTGYSSLSYLRRLPVDEVKIDRSFVYRMVQEPDDAAIVRSIVELARALSLEVVAEGVEDDATWQALHELGVDEIQGWVVAKAMPPAEFRAWAAQWAAAHAGRRLRAV